MALAALHLWFWKWWTKGTLMLLQPGLVAQPLRFLVKTTALERPRWTPTALVLAKPENLKAFKFIKLLGSTENCWPSRLMTYELLNLRHSHTNESDMVSE
eukprot:Amastigsp_a5383_3.p3 type:complete len:100 gc:universal Amastigsp_a5383_3:159-458(+)